MSHRRLDHLALAVQDQERSRRFYREYFAFEAEPEAREDGTLMTHNADGFSLALGHAEGPPSMPRFFHFGFAAESPDDVRAMRDRLVADGVEVVEEWDEPGYVSVKFRDPDGYVIEYGWEARG